jgi:hypothetical protein
MQALRENQRRAGLEPIDARPQRDRRGVEGLVDVGEVERDLHDRFHGTKA